MKHHKRIKRTTQNLRKYPNLLHLLINFTRRNYKQYQCAGLIWEHAFNYFIGLKLIKIDKYHRDYNIRECNWLVYEFKCYRSEYPDSDNVIAKCKELFEKEKNEWAERVNIYYSEYGYVYKPITVQDYYDSWPEFEETCLRSPEEDIKAILATRFPEENYPEPQKR